MGWAGKKALQFNVSDYWVCSKISLSATAGCLGKQPDIMVHCQHDLLVKGFLGLAINFKYSDTIMYKSIIYKCIIPLLYVILFL